MSSSLKEQLLKLGLGRDVRPEPKQPRARPAPAGRRPPAKSDEAQRPSRRQMREIERERQAREGRLRERIEAAKLDDPAAEVRRYYSTGKKIKRIYVTEAQQAALARGEIVIAVAHGRGRLVASALVDELRAIDPDVRIIDASAIQESAVDPDHAVPDDLRW